MKKQAGVSQLPPWHVKTAPIEHAEADVYPSRNNHGTNVKVKLEP